MCSATLALAIASLSVLQDDPVLDERSRRWIERLPDPPIYEFRFDYRVESSHVMPPPRLFDFPDDPQERLEDAEEKLARKPDDLKTIVQAMTAGHLLQDNEVLHHYMQQLLRLYNQTVEEANEEDNTAEFWTAAGRGFELLAVRLTSPNNYAERAIDAYRRAWAVGFRDPRIIHRVIGVFIQLALRHPAESAQTFEFAYRWLDRAREVHPDDPRLAFDLLLVRFMEFSIDCYLDPPTDLPEVVRRLGPIDEAAAQLAQACPRQIDEGIAYVAESIALSVLHFGRLQAGHDLPSGETLAPMDEAAHRRVLDYLEWTLTSKALHPEQRQQGRTLGWGLLVFGGRPFDHASILERIVEQGVPASVLQRDAILGFDSTGQPELARQYADDLLAHAATSPSLRTIAWLEVQRDRPDRALEVLAKIEDADAEVSLFRAVLFLQQERVGRARAELDRHRIEDVDEQDRAAYGHALAVCLACQGNLQAALPLLAIEPIDPDHQKGRAETLAEIRTALQDQ